MKKIILVILLFLVSGCSANYELTIDEDLNFMENISLQAENEIERFYDLFMNADSLFSNHPYTKMDKMLK